MIAWSVTLAWGGFSTTLPMLYLSRIFLGLSEGILYPVCNVFVARWFAVRERGRAQAVWFNGATVGGAVGGLLVTTVVVISGWRVAFLALACSVSWSCYPCSGSSPAMTRAPTDG